jgi:hypothetical protein
MRIVAFAGKGISRPTRRIRILRRSGCLARMFSIGGVLSLGSLGMSLAHIYLMTF